MNGKRVGGGEGVSRLWELGKSESVFGGDEEEAHTTLRGAVAACVEEAVADLVPAYKRVRCEYLLHNKMQ